ncbi:MAG: helix-turn-helix domain-containing protein [Bacteroidota bacterium]
MENLVMLHNLNLEQLKTLVENVVITGIKKVLAESISQKTTSTEVNLLTRKEVSKLLKISLTTLNSRMKKGDLPFKRNGRRVLFQESEIMKAIDPTKRKRG